MQLRNDGILTKDHKTKYMRLYSSCPKLIKFNDFLMTKLAETHGKLLISSLSQNLALFDKLSDFLQDFGFVIDELNLDTLAEDYLSFGVDLAKQGLIAESFNEQEKSI